MHHRLHFLAALGLAALAGCGSSGGSSSRQATIVAIEPPVAGQGLDVTNLNDLGQVVGQVDGGSFIYQDGQMRSLVDISASAINNNGLVVGTRAAGGDQKPIRFEDSNVIDLPLSGTSSAGFANAVNDQGEVVGSRLWLVGGATDLALPLGTFNLGATSINASGQVVGNQRHMLVGDPGRPWEDRAYLWTNGTLQLIPLLPGDNRSTATDINASGQVVGYSRGDNSPSRAWIYENGSVRELSGPGGSLVGATSINDQGEIVGNNGSGPALYRNGSVVPLDSLLPPGSGWVLQEALVINNRSQIIGTGTLNGVQKRFLLSL